MKVSSKEQQGHISAKLVIFFVVLIIVVLAVNTITIYLTRSNAYKEQSIENMKQLGFFLRDQLVREGDTFSRADRAMYERKKAMKAGR